MDNAMLDVKSEPTHKGPDRERARTGPTKNVLRGTDYFRLRHQAPIATAAVPAPSRVSVVGSGTR